MIDCPHLIDAGCQIAGNFCGVPTVPVAEDACTFCTTKTKEPKAPNSVTAGLALRWLRQNDEERLAQVKSELYGYLQGCANRTPAKNGEAAKADCLRLVCELSPGDMMTLTAAVESLVKAYPGKWKIQVAGTAMDIWQNNPHIHELDCGEQETALLIKMEYPVIHRSNQTHVPFVAGYTDFLGAVLGVNLPLLVNRPHLYLSADEKSWMSQIQELTGDRRPYAIVDAGVKSDYTAKQWPVEYYQEIVNQTKDQIEWVQIGSAEHDHPLLDNVIDLRGETDTRQLIRLVYHCQLAIGPVTFLQHLSAAWEKPYLCMLGGREPLTWVNYPKQHTFHTIGQLSCCQDTACWKSKITGGDSVCEFPVLTGIRPVGKCMQSITPTEVLCVLRRLLPNVDTLQPRSR